MSTLDLPALALMVFGATALDRLLGETRRFHPLIGFGDLAARLEQRYNRDALDVDNSAQARRRGIVLWLILVLLPTLVTAFLMSQLDALWQLLVGTILLYIVIGGRSLQEHASRVYQDLQSANLNDARTHVSWLVSRDTRQLDATGVSKACIESVLENGNDALFAPIFWFCILGPAGAVLYRLANTLDAMWGYRTQRYINFGRAAARLDDLLNYFPARLTALSYAFVGHTRHAIDCWRTQASDWDSPNAGPVMAAGAGALDLQLGGAADYHGATEARPPLGSGNDPTPADIPRAQQLLRHALRVWLAAIAASAIATAIF